MHHLEHIESLTSRPEKRRLRKVLEKTRPPDFQTAVLPFENQLWHRRPSDYHINELEAFLQAPPTYQQREAD